MKLLVLTLVAAFGLTSQAAPRAQATFSKTLAFPISSLEKLEQSMQDAAARKGDDRKVEVSYQIDPNFTLVCAEDSPVKYDGHLYGCVLQTIADLGGTTVLMRNMVYQTQSSQEVKDVLAKTDVNAVDSVQLKTLFDGGHGSKYFCNAEGAAGARQWGCYLYFVD